MIILLLYATALQMIDLLLLVSDVCQIMILWKHYQQQNKEYMEKIIDQNNRNIAYLVRKGHVY